MEALLALFKLPKTAEKKVVVRNFFSLSFLETANYVLPLLTLPYLLRVLGPEKFGLLAFAESFVLYFGILADYGFNLSAVREISIGREDPARVGGVYSAVIALKVCFLIACLLVMAVVVFSVPRFRQDWPVYFLSFGMVAGQCIFPVWFFQGMERMKYITLLNIAAKFFFTVSIFVFVRDAADYMRVPLIQSAGFLMMGATGLWVAYRDFGIGFSLPSRVSMAHQLKEGWYLFMSRVSMSLYTTSSTFILGLFAGNTVVGYFSAGDKVIRAALRPIAPVSDAVYPYISKLAHRSAVEAVRFIRRLILFIGGGTFLLSALILLYAPFIAGLIFGSSYGESVPVLRIMAFVPFFATMSTLLGTQTMLTFNLKKEFSRILIAAGAFHIVLTFLLAGRYQHIGVALAVLCTEIFVVTLMYFYLRAKGLIALRPRA